MITRIGLILFLATSLAYASQTDDKSAEEIKKFQGQWTLHALEINGKEVEAARIENTFVAVQGNEYVVHIKDKKLPCTIKVDPAKDPKEIDMIFTEPGAPDKLHKGIYRFKDDTFQICRGLEPNRDRPNQFGTWPDTGVFMVTWKKKTP